MANIKSVHVIGSVVDGNQTVVTLLILGDDNKLYYCRSSALAIPKIGESAEVHLGFPFKPTP